ncbi:hypothetical protein CERSUDRAFT_76780 [Gelatoporia subvermispora B]|uniref:Uncharacterized protein n=1 Tax=Ceriporiopsis subvermispora (strain B) TaxID=914234 RepID=M2R4D9_CERS8|nr:hypothetical protein CERSUDRAFT_76780 [Gelatoporia subvermispora B]
MRYTVQQHERDTEQRFQQQVMRFTVQRHGCDVEQQFQQQARQYIVRQYEHDTERRFQQQATRFTVQRHGCDVEQRFQREAGDDPRSGTDITRNGGPGDKEREYSWGGAKVGRKRRFRSRDHRTHSGGESVRLRGSEPEGKYSGGGEKRRGALPDPLGRDTILRKDRVACSRVPESACVVSECGAKNLRTLVEVSIPYCRISAVLSLTSTNLGGRIRFQLRPTPSITPPRRQDSSHESSWSASAELPSNTPFITIQSPCPVPMLSGSKTLGNLDEVIHVRASSPSTASVLKDRLHMHALGCPLPAGDSSTGSRSIAGRSNPLGISDSQSRRSPDLDQVFATCILTTFMTCPGRAALKDRSTSSPYTACGGDRPTITLAIAVRSKP